MPRHEAPSDQGSALILAGAVAKGAFEAGAIEVLAEAEVVIARIVGASAGAINGVMLASAIRAGRMREAALMLSRIWRDEVSLGAVFDFELNAALQGRGLASEDKVLGLLRKYVHPVRIPQAERKPVNLRLVVAPLAGVRVSMAGTPASTYEKVLEFCDQDFDSEAGLARVFDAAVASAAFPGAFLPKTLPGLGPGIDGGLVNNAPIARALRDSAIRRIYAVVPAPLRAPRTPSMRWLSLVSHLAEILLDERFFHDVRAADEVNHVLRALQRLAETGVLHPEQHAAVLDALGWQNRRVIDIVQIRPERELAGNAFSGFLDAELRQQYIQEGRRAAQAALGRLTRTPPSHV